MRSSTGVAATGADAGAATGAATGPAAAAAAVAGVVAVIGTCSTNRIRASPTVTTSPGARSADVTLWPFTRMPLRLPRSVTRGTGPEASNSAW